jgi:hypothetical protein
MARVEWIAITGCLLLIGIIVELIRRRKLAEGYSLLWLLAGFVLLLLAIWREVLHIFATAVGVFYPPAALFLVGFIFFFLILLQFSVVISQLSRHNKTLAQQIALLRQEIQQLQAQKGADE